MDAKLFYKTFTQSLRVPEQKEKALQVYKTNKAWTSFFKRLIQEILEEIDKNYYPEYYRIDASSYKFFDESEMDDILQEKPAVNFCRHLWIPETLVEYENDDRKWMDEVIKLCPIAAKLKIVIGYVPQENEQQNYIDYASRAVKHVLPSIKLQDNTEPEFLILLGSSKCDGEVNLANNYSPYLWNSKNGTFEKQSWDTEVR